jgi:hypothetical protein
MVALMMGCFSQGTADGDASSAVVMPSWRAGDARSADRAKVLSNGTLEIGCDGICRFQMSSPITQTVTVVLLYGDGRLFDRIEGLDVEGATARRWGDGGADRGFEIDLQAGAAPARIQVIDMYRD